MLHHVNDNLGVVEALGETAAVIVGHDWGSPIAANSALLRPGCVSGRGPPERALQPSGAAPADGGVRRAMGRRRGVLHQLLPGARTGRGRSRTRRARLAARLLHRCVRRCSPAARRRAPWHGPAGAAAAGPVRHPDQLPAWLTRSGPRLLRCASSRATGSGAPSTATATWTGTGWTCSRGAASPSRCRRCSSAASATGRPSGAQRAIARFPETLPGLRGSHILPGCGHWVQQERAEEVNDLLVGWLQESLPRQRHRRMASTDARRRPRRAGVGHRDAHAAADPSRRCRPSSRCRPAGPRR